MLHTELNANKCNEEEEAMISDDEGTQNLLQTLENQNTQTLSCEFRNKQEQKEVSMALTLFDKSWVSSNNMRATATSISILFSHSSIVDSNTQEDLYCSQKQTKKTQNIKYLASSLILI